jgi:hypothetical protein
MLMTKERPPAIRAMRGWAISVLEEAGAIIECEEHGWMHDRGRSPCPGARQLGGDVAQELVSISRRDRTGLLPSQIRKSSLSEIMRTGYFLN